MAENPRRSRFTGSRRYWLLLIAGLTFVIIGITLVGILKSRRDSYNLLVRQGTVFTEALALACQNTIVSEAYYDRLVTDQYSDLVEELTSAGFKHVQDADLAKFADKHDLAAVYVYDSSGRLLLSDVSNSPFLRTPAVVDSAVRRLASDFQNRSTLVYSADTTGGPGLLYYLQITNQLDRIVVLAITSNLYEEAIDRTGIGVLAQSMAEEPGIEYIVYQAPSGIIFSSLRGGTFEAVESDPFLKTALDSDTIMTRNTKFQDREILELVRPFSTRRFPFGLLRVGVTLEGYFTVTRGFDQLMIVLSLTLFALMVVGVLYTVGRQERAGLRRDLSDMRYISEQIFGGIDTGVAVVGSDRKIRFANRAFEKIIGATEISGRELNAIDSPFAEVAARFAHATTGERERELTAEIDGVNRTMLIGRSPLVLKDRAWSGIVLVTTDITQLKEYQQAAARRERLSELGHLAAGVAHEIRNPLNAISIATQRLEKEIQPADHRDEFFGFTGQIRTEAKRLNEIITRFLSLTREQQSPKSPVDPAPICEQFAGLVAAEASGLGIEFSVSCESSLRMAVPADQIKELLLNLYNNAKEALASKPGKIAVAVRRSHQGVVFTVADSGPGIPAEIREKVFAPYFTTKEGGTGIGLAVVHKIAEDFGGTAAISESPLGGAQISVTFPPA